MKNWDVFLSHASEDKQAVAIPLADALIRSGLRVWLDRFEVKVGDSLREAIDEGLSESRFGIVVLSESFLGKGWPKNELNGLFAKEVDGEKVILPVWHGIDRAAVARFSPILSDRVAADTSMGIHAVSRAIAEAILHATPKGESQQVGLAAQLVRLLGNGPNPAHIRTFLGTYCDVLPAAMGHLSRNSSIGYDYEESCQYTRPGLADLCVSYGTTALRELVYFYFCPAEGALFEGNVANVELGRAIDRAGRLIQSVEDGQTQPVRSREESYYQPIVRSRAIILSGRRDSMSTSDKAGIGHLHSRGIEVRSYDWLIEACVTVDNAAHTARVEAQNRAREIAAWEETVFRAEIDSNQRPAFFLAVDALLKSSPGTLHSNLNIFIPRLLLQWDSAPYRVETTLDSLGGQAIAVAVEAVDASQGGIVGALLDRVGSLQLATRGALRLIERCLACDDNARRAESITTIGKLKAAGQPFSATLLTLVRTGDKQIRGNAALALGRIGDHSAACVSCLTGLLADEDVLVRLKAGAALELLGPNATAATAALERCLADESHFVREAVRRALVAIRRTGT